MAKEMYDAELYDRCLAVAGMRKAEYQAPFLAASRGPSTDGADVIACVLDR